MPLQNRERTIDLLQQHGSRRSEILKILVGETGSAPKNGQCVEERRLG